MEKWVTINGAVNTEKTMDEWLNDFIQWLESRNECFFGFTKDYEDNEEDEINMNS
jgi:hypothetical protein